MIYSFEVYSLTIHVEGDEHTDETSRMALGEALRMIREGHAGLVEDPEDFYNDADALVQWGYAPEDCKNRVHPIDRGGI